LEVIKHLIFLRPIGSISFAFFANTHGINNFACRAMLRTVILPYHRQINSWKFIGIGFLPRPFKLPKMGVNMLINTFINTAVVVDI